MMTKALAALPVPDAYREVGVEEFNGYDFTVPGIHDDHGITITHYYERYKDVERYFVPVTNGPAETL